MELNDDVAEESPQVDDEHRDDDAVLRRDRHRDRAEAAGAPNLPLQADCRGRRGRRGAAEGEDNHHDDNIDNSDDDAHDDIIEIASNNDGETETSANDDDAVFSATAAVDTSSSVGRSGREGRCGIELLAF